MQIHQEEVRSEHDHSTLLTDDDVSKNQTPAQNMESNQEPQLQSNSWNYVLKMRAQLGLNLDYFCPEGESNFNGMRLKD